MKNEATPAKAPFLKIVPMLGSLGCPYTCSFCIDTDIPYQPLDFDVLKNDLRFLLKKLRRPRIAWHDPNFGVRFEDYMDAILGPCLRQPLQSAAIRPRGPLLSVRWCRWPGQANLPDVGSVQTLLDA